MFLIDNNGRRNISRLEDRAAEHDRIIAVARAPQESLTGVVDTVTVVHPD